MLLDQIESDGIIDADGKDLILQLMKKDYLKRLGCGPADKNLDMNALKNHAFFKTIDFQKLAKKELDPKLPDSLIPKKLNLEKFRSLQQS